MDHQAATPVAGAMPATGGIIIGLETEPAAG